MPNTKPRKKHPPAASASQLQAVLADTRFLAGCDVAVSACSPGTCELTMPFDARLERPGGIVSGMTIMGVADVAMWLAIMTIRGTRETWVTSDMKTAFLRSGRKETIRCRATVLKHGARVAYGVVDTTGERSGLLAHHVITYTHVPSASA
jgi:uncharacterized protein (TIGR00369 family)